MPKRTTPFQMIVHSVRKHTATPGVTVTESKELFDPQLNTTREVDVVVEGDFDGEPVVTSIEVMQHGRPASLPWVEQQIGKHQHLPTNLLVLVSKSGFSQNALARVAAEGGWVQTMSPRPVDGTNAVAVFFDAIHLTPSSCKFVIDHPQQGPIEVVAEAGFTIYDADERELGKPLSWLGSSSDGGGSWRRSRRVHTTTRSAMSSSDSQSGAASRSWATTCAMRRPASFTLSYWLRYKASSRSSSLSFPSHSPSWEIGSTALAKD